MSSLHSLAALAAVALVTACASPGSHGTAPDPTAQAGEAASPKEGRTASAPMPGMETHMQAMREMRDKMSRATTPEERQALMADHMKAMHGGMQTMGGMGGMGDSKGMPADPALRQQAMEQRMDMMQTMMEMMMQRMPGAPAPAVVK